MKKRPLIPLKILKAVAKAAYDHKAEDFLALDMTSIANFCDYFFICTVSSDRRMRTVAEAIRDDMEKEGYPVVSPVSLDSGTWILLDFGSIIVHIFEAETRKFYNLEHLWQDAKVIDLEKKKAS